MENRATDETQTASPFDDDTDITKLAQAAIRYREKYHQTPDMESVKALLRNFLDDIKESQTERSSYLDGLLSQWLDIWQRDRTHSLLIYVLGDRSEHYGNRMLDFNDLETVDKIKTRILEQQCSQQGVCLYLAKMKSAVDTDPNDDLELKMAISLHEISDLSGGLLGNKPVSVGRESILQKGMLKERCHQQIARQNPYPSPIEGTPSLQIDTAKSFEDWVSPSYFPLRYSLSMDSSQIIQVLLMMPEGYRFKFLTYNADPQALHDWINTQSANVQPLVMDRAGADPNVHWGLALACKTQLNNIGTWLATDFIRGVPREFNQQTKMLKAVIRASLGLRDLDLFQRAVTLHPRLLSLSMWEEVGTMIELGDFLSYQSP